MGGARWEVRGGRREVGRRIRGGGGARWDGGGRWEVGGRVVARAKPSAPSTSTTRDTLATDSKGGGMGEKICFLFRVTHAHIPTVFK